MSRLDELEDRIMTLERIVSNILEEVHGEEEEEFNCTMFSEPKRYVNKLVTQEDGTMKFMRVEVTE